MALISIIVPVYNDQHHLSECVNSILAQTHKNIELILINDGSTDNSPAICDEYSQQDNRIVVIHKANGGVSSARNTGIKLASGKYVMFCDADDFVSPNWCEELHKGIEENPDKWIISDICRYNDDGTILNTERKNAYKDNLSYFDIFEDFLSAYTVNKIYSLEKLRNNNITFDENRKIGEDVLFNIQYFSQCNGIEFIPKVLYYYRYNSDSAMNKYRANEFEINIPLFNARRSLINSDEISSFCDMYLSMFLKWLGNTFDKRNGDSFFKKMKYNQKMMNSDEFKFCVSHASGNNDSPLFMKVVRMHNYYIYWCFIKITNLKQKI